jgi:hypothetical protein
MKKLVLFFWTFVLCFTLAYAKPVGENRALALAQNYLTAHSLQASPGTTPLLSLCYAPSEAYTLKPSGANQPLFYVFNIRSNAGFIIIAGDDAVYPVLGYSLDRGFDASAIPAHVEAWLKGYALQISLATASGMEPTPLISTQWETYGDSHPPVNNTKSSLGVNPLVATLWDQSPYYNAQCPFDNTANELTVTGCVATAMAMVMKYHNFPPSGTGNHSYNHSRYGTLSANFGGTTYNWAAMPNTVNSANSAVATLMYHCGVSVDMDYNTAAAGGSSAYIITAMSPVTHCTEYALKTYFGYASTLQGVQRVNYTTADWKALLKTELNASRPIIYAGFGTGGGHCFVCDGYNDSDYFHFNWGWGGSYDGYFLIDALNPGGTGTGGGTGAYNDGHQAVIGVKPAAASGGGGHYYKLAMNAPISCASDTIQYEGALSFSTNITNTGNVTFNGDLCAAMFDTNDVFIRNVQVIRGVSLAAGAQFPSPVVFSNPGISALLPGPYYVDIVYSEGDSSWRDVNDNGSLLSYRRIEVVSNNDIELQAAMSLTPGPVIIQGAALSVVLDLRNKGASNFHGILDLSVYDLDGDSVLFIGQKSNVSIASGAQANDLSFGPASVILKPGTYLLALWYQESGSSSWKLAGSGSFDNPLKIELEAAPLAADAFEPNNTQGAATLLPVSFSTNPATVSTPGANCHTGVDYDYYRIDLPPGYTYILTGSLHDFVSDTSRVYTLEGMWSCSADGQNWSDVYDNVISEGLRIDNGGSVWFKVSPKFTGETGTYLALVNIARNPLGVSDFLADDGLRIYPNPCSGKVNVHLSLEAGFPGSYLIHSADGRLVAGGSLPAGHRDHTLDVSGLPFGTYILSISTEKGVVRGVLVVGS